MGSEETGVLAVSWNQMDKDRIKGSAKQAKGAVKEARVFKRSRVERASWSRRVTVNTSPSTSPGSSKLAEQNQDQHP
jgi:hypothetical protein